MLKDRRLGKFTIAVEAINDTPHVVKDVMSTVIVLRAECLLDQQCVEYFAQCDEFEEIPEGAILPVYDVAVDMDENTITWSRVK